MTRQWDRLVDRLFDLDRQYPLLGQTVEADVAFDYNPNQPRAPKGTPEGGQWTSGTALPQWSEMTEEEQDKLLHDLYERGFKEPLTTEEKDALELYTIADGPAWELNRMLRRQKLPIPSSREAAFLAAMDSAFSKASLPQDVTVYRGLEGNAWTKLVQHLSDNDVFFDKGFISTSFDKETAESFMEDSAGGLLEIVLRKGSKAIAVDPISAHESEQEIILNRGSEFVVNESWVIGPRIMRVEVL